ncbi:cyanobacterial porin [Leptolyngbya sp. Heron Island J]|uniref:iron uptake porin n=1 Tax=Leptolyngbya sp. Heron Island J TaxID=1385935 RepID=UPI0003B9EC66|nr:iron uptake porin [Leptolyngbya sp. Heron Island J]ESA37906.1 cyanobacterial porin [Leptolyngbya sp. Heron Island J]
MKFYLAVSVSFSLVLSSHAALATDEQTVLTLTPKPNAQVKSLAIDSTNLKSFPVEELASQLPDSSETSSERSQVLLVDQLSDVQPTDWAFQALQSLIETYGAMTGYPDGTFQGNRPLSRNEFAASLIFLLHHLGPFLARGELTEAEFETLQRLQTEFAEDLKQIRSNLNGLETRLIDIENNQFSTTTTLSGQAIFAVNTGGFGSDRIIAPRGAVITDDQPDANFIYRVSLNFNTSFRGSDLLQIRLVTGSDGTTDNTTGLLEPNFGSGLDFSNQGRNGRVSLARAYYRFAPSEDVSLTVGGAMTAADTVDKNRYAGASFRDFSTQALVNNFILFPRGRGAGAAVDWNPSSGPFSFRAVYIAGDADNSLPENQAVFGGGSPDDIRLFPVGGGGASGGLFGDPYQGVFELEYAPSEEFAVRLQYSGGRVFGSAFSVLGVNAELALSEYIGLFGRYGSGSYPNTTIGDIHPHYWSAGITFQDLFAEGEIAGFAVGQPFIEDAVGNATQSNFEAFYNFPVCDRIRVTPLIQVVTNPANQSSNGTIAAFTLRTVFSF